MYNRNRNHIWRWERLAERDFKQELDELRAGKIDQFEIGPDNFQEFQRIYHAYPYRTQITGQAYIGGKIIYRMIKR